LVGPDFDKPPVAAMPDWYFAEVDSLRAEQQAEKPWWQLLGDPDLDRLIEQAQLANNTLELAGLRVLESRAQLGVALGSRYPQTQIVGGAVTSVQASENAANTAAGDLSFTDYGVGASVAWEIDFWGRFRRGIEAADATLMASEAAYDQALLLVTSQVALTYLAIRSTEEQIRITRQNIANQERSYNIVKVQFDNGATSELDVLQAEALLLGTQATLPSLRASLTQAYNALDTLLGNAPGGAREALTATSDIPQVPEAVAIGFPADVLRQRPDVQAAEFAALAQNAAVGLATADLYPSFSLVGTIGLSAAGNTNTTRSGESGFDQLFDSKSLTYSAGPTFVWPFLNYGRIKNNIRVQDAQLQQALNAAEASLAAATAIEEQARQASERASAMLERGVGTRAARDAARQELSAAETRTRQAKSALDKARRSLGYQDVLANLERSGIAIRVASPKLVMEEAPESYKDVTQVVETCHQAGISKKCVKLRPIACIKG